MPKERPRSVLILDDTQLYRSSLSASLEDSGYSVVQCKNISDALAFLDSNAHPTFIFVDRQLEEGYVEDCRLEEIGSMAYDSFVIVYTIKEELSIHDRNRILSRGAIRVIDRKEAEEFGHDISQLTAEFDRLLVTAREIDRALRERNMLVSVLLGTSARISIIDREFHCWYENYGRVPPNYAIGKKGPCWQRFHGLPSSATGCWGCSVRQVLRKHLEVDGIRLSTYFDGSVKWESIRCVPIYSEDKEIVAVLNCVTDAPSTVISSLDLYPRLQHIADSLLARGFGGVRIHELTPGGGRIVAAARCTDPEDVAAERPYILRVKGYPIQPGESKYIDDAIASKNGIFVSVDTWKETPSRFQEVLGHEPPFFTLPVRDERGIDRAVLCLDFVGLAPDLKADVVRDFSQEDGEPMLRWLQDTFCREIASAYRDSMDVHNPELMKWYDVVQNARLTVIADPTLQRAKMVVTEALSSLVPECGFSICYLDGSDLRIYADLSREPGPTYSGGAVRVNDARSFAAYVHRIHHPLWIDNLEEYPARRASTGEPEGYSLSPEIASMAAVPLRIQKISYGALLIFSRTPVRWEADRRVGPILDFADLAALVVRDLILYEQLETAKDKQAAIIACLAGTSGDSEWRHRTLHRLDEVLMKITSLCRRLDPLQQTYPHDKEEGEPLADITSELGAIGDIIGRIRHAGPSHDVAGQTPLNEIAARMRERYAGKGVSLILQSFEDWPVVNVPRRRVEDMLYTILDNSVEALSAQMGDRVIEVEVNSSETQARIQIRNNGPEITQRAKSILFRGQVPSEKGQGMGLLIARGIAIQYKGELRLVTSSPGDTVFALELPLPGGAGRGQDA